MIDIIRPLILSLLLFGNMSAQSNELIQILGKEISKISIDANNPERTSVDYKFYISLKDTKQLFNKAYDHIIINTDESNRVASIKISLLEIIDESFYNRFVESFGPPASIEVVDKSITVGAIERNSDSTKQSISKKFITTKPGTFRQMPLHMMWETNDAQIEILMKYREGISQITFRPKIF